MSSIWNHHKHEYGITVNLNSIWNHSKWIMNDITDDGNCLFRMRDIMFL